MTSSSNRVCPLGPHLQHYWDRLSEMEKKMELDEEGLFSLALQPVALEIAMKTPGKVVVDAFCGAGGMAIGFARRGKRVIAVDDNKARLSMAKRNAALFGVEGAIDFLLGDALGILPTLKADAIFLDPPWGGTDYNEKGQFYLRDFEPNGRKLLDLAFTLSGAVVMRLPKNFELSELDTIGRDYELEENMLDGRLLHYCVYFK